MTIDSINVIRKYQRVIQRLAGPRLWQLLLLSLISTSLEGLGLILFLPLLNLAGISGGSDPFSRLLESVLNLIGLQLSLPPVLCLVIGVAVVKSYAEFKKECFLLRLRADVIDDLRRRTMLAFSRLQYSYYLKKEAGYFSNFIGIEVPKISDAFYNYGAVLTQLVTICVLLIFSVALNWKFTILAILLGGGLSVLLKSFSIRSKLHSRENSEINARLSGLLIQSVHNFKYLLSTANFNRVNKRVFSTGEEIKATSYRLSSLSSFVRAIAEPTAVLVMVALIYFEVYLLGGSLASLMVSMLIFYRCLRMVLGFQAVWQNFNAVAGALDYVYEGFDQMEAHRELESGTGERPTTGEIRLRGVSFSFGKTPIFHNLNLEIKDKSTIALVGHSGAGKSTLVDLITGTLPPNDGEISISRMPFGKIDLSEWRSRIGYVTQDCAIFDDTIRNNISLWSPDFTKPELERKVLAAAKEAHILELIESLPEGLDTRIGDRGMRLSGGQRQRLAIARELFKEPLLLIMDEATSALDNESEQIIKDSLARIKGSLTIVMIAHRLSTVKDADCIYVLDRGRIAEMGDFKSLINVKGSLFERLYSGGQN